MELHSPDIKSSCILRFPDLVTGSDWFNALHSNVTVLMAQALTEANVIMSTAPNQREIRHIGWLSEQVCYDKCSKISNIFLFQVSNKMLVIRKFLSE